MRKILIIVFLISLTACKPQLNITLKLSELLSGESKLMNVKSFIEVASCKDYDNPDEESASLAEVKQKIPYHFNGALFVECHKRGFSSYAEFDFPVALDLVSDGKFFSDSHLNISSSIKDGNLITFYMPEEFRKKVTRLENETLSSDGFDIILKLIIDTDFDEAFTGNTLWYGFNDDSLANLEPIYMFKSNPEGMKEVRSEQGDFALFFKPAQVIIDLALAGKPAPFLRIEKAGQN